MEIILAVLALEGVNEDGLAEGAEELWADATGLSSDGEDLPCIHREAHSLELVVGEHLSDCLSRSMIISHPLLFTLYSI